MVVTVNPDLKDEATKLYQEAKELHLIFNAISRKVSAKNLDIRHS